MNTYLKRALRPLFKAVASLPVNNPHTPFELGLMISGKKPTCILSSTDIDVNSPYCTDKDGAVNFLKAVEKGQIILIGKHKPDNIPEVIVYAQKENYEEGKELFSRYYQGSEGYPILSQQDSFKRIGLLLGYNENDLGRPNCGALKDYILRETRDTRLKIRHEFDWEMGVNS